ncbi:MAG: adenosine deaminase [Chlorobia bacterium]|nr:adenosine deaminase [Fimbriimonadaceae bacterium]
MVTRDELLRMPKVELHVHLEGSIRPETLLKLAKRHAIPLPADDIAGLREWYRFRDFPHFVEVYVAISKCLRTPEDLELVAREFLEGQAEQNIRHSEVTYTAATIEQHVGIPFEYQMKALRNAIRYGKEELGISMSLILDIVRGMTPERAHQVAEWTVANHRYGVCALGIAGEEHRGTTEYASAFQLALDSGVPIVAHAGETCGSEVIWDSLNYAQATRIGHGVRCLDDSELVAKLRELQTPLEVCPSSNVCLGVFPSWEQHPLKKLMDEGLCVTLNSDDPPMFGTTLTDEFLRACETFGFGMEECRALTSRAVAASFLGEAEKAEIQP